ncbi:hypothetical protein BLNAU_15139 [Blattamonas nauphoetae]|uniref:Protein kinase domain-containing protein n=1 Tax=Blattamonas nauphoetae TaxID=2049346 RepID=A0ABQ9XET7_9EUKA|nr:hypothetical protein BLNAU_15139 [Blattamonas nauphoetae]
MILFILGARLFSGAVAHPDFHSAFPTSPAVFVPLSAIIEQHQSNRNTNTDNGEQFVLGSTTYCATSLEINSRHLTLLGDRSTLTHEGTNIHSKQKMDKSAKTTTGLPQKPLHSVLLLVNCTIVLDSLNLVVNVEHCSICSIAASDLSVKNCEVSSTMSLSPFVVDSWSAGTSSSISIENSRYSGFSSTTILPFVDVDSAMDSLNSGRSADLFAGTEGPKVTICGTGLSILDSSLPLSTGPLFSFTKTTRGSEESGSVLEVETVLLSSLVQNVTSPNIANCWMAGASQKMIGTRLRESTNHISGTGCVDMNFGGSLLSLNSSFSNCVRTLQSLPNDEQDKIGQKFKQGDRLTVDNLSTSNILINSCTFDTMSFHDSTGFIEEAAAIDICQRDVPITIQRCSFYKCAVTGQHPDGGAIYLRYSSSYPNNNKIHVSDSSFVDCTTTLTPSTLTEGTNCGGGICITSCLDITLERLSFHHCFATSRGGGMYLDRSLGTVSNVLLDTCESMIGGGMFQVLGSITHSFIFFRNNIAATGAEDTAYLPAPDTNPFTNCDTTASDPTCYVQWGTPIKDWFSSISAEMQLIDFSINFGQDSATLSVTAAEAVSGSMIVVVEGGNMPRLASVSFSSNTKGEGTVPIEMNGVLEAGTIYGIRAAGMKGRVLFGNMVVGATAKLLDENRTNVIVSGIILSEGTYFVMVKDTTTGTTETLTLPMTLSGKSLLSVEKELSVEYEAGKLQYEHEYSVEEVLCDGASVSVKSGTSFVIPPQPSRLAEVKVINASDWVALTLTGTVFYSSEYSVTLTEVTESSEKHTKTITLSKNASRGVMKEWKAILFPIESQDLKYGKTYCVTSMIPTDGTDSIAISAAPFKIPDEPARIIGVSCVLDENKNTTSFKLRGRQIPTGIHKIILNNASGVSFNVEFSGGLSEVRDSDVKSLEIYGTTPVLSFNTAYSLFSVGSFLIDTRNHSFSTPVEPARIVGVSCELDVSGNTTSFKLRGRQIPTGTYTVVLNNASGLSFVVEFSTPISDERDSDVKSLKIYGSNPFLSFNTAYSLFSVGSFLIDTRNHSFTVAEPPRIIGVSCELNENKNTTSFKLRGRQIPSGTYEVILNDANGPSFDITFSDPLSEERDSDLKSLKIYGSSPFLSFGTLYTLFSVASFLIDTRNHSFRTAIEPARIVGVSCVLDESGNTTSFKLKGRQIPSGTYEVILNDANGPSFDITFSDPLSEERDSDVKSLTISGSNPVLSFGTLYTLFSVKSFLIDEENKSFAVAEPPRIVGVSCVLDESGNTTSLKLKGRQIPVGTHKVTLNDANGPSFDIKFSSPLSDERESDVTTVSIFGDGSLLSFNTTYKLFSVGSFLIDSGNNSFSISEPSRLTSVGSVLFADDRKTTISIELVGVEMPTTPLKLFVVKEGDPEDKKVSLDATFSTKETGTAIGVGFSENEEEKTIAFGLNYTVVGLKDGDNDILIVSGLEIEMPAEPARIVLTSCTDGVNATKVKVEGVGLSEHTTYTLSVSGTPTSSRQNTEPHVTTIEVIGVSTTEAESEELALYPVSEAELRFGFTYEITGASVNSKPVLVESTPSFSTPTEPARIEDASCSLSKNRTSVTIVISGTALPDSDVMVTFKKEGETSTFPPQTAVCSSSGTFSFSMLAGDTPSSTQLQYGSRYVITSVKHGSDEMEVNWNVGFTVDHPPRLSSIVFSFSNTLHTSFELELIGDGLTLLGEYELTLNSSFKMDVILNGGKTGRTIKAQPIGFESCLDFSTTYTVTSLHLKTDESDKVVFDTVSFETKAKPTRIEIFVDSSSTFALPLCGEMDRPCTRMDDGWWIVSTLAIDGPTLRILNRTTLSSGIVIGSGMHVLFSPGDNIEPTLRIPSSATMNENGGLIWMSEGSFELRDVDVEIESSSASFVFVLAVDSTLIVKDGSICGPTPSSNSGDMTETASDETICAWSSGVLQLTNTETNLTSSSFSRLSQGLVNMKNGSLHVVSSSFYGNKPSSLSSSSSFPSFRRNIRCSEGGRVEIGSLSGGDGGSETTRSAWIQIEEDCTLTSEVVSESSPFFIPTLDTSKTSISTDPKKPDLNVTLVGTQLIPCGLFLEIVEIEKKTEKNSTFLELTSETTRTLTETEVSLSLLISSVGLDGNLEWRGRLRFGENVPTSSFLLKQSAVDERKALMTQTMKWLLPVICSLVLLLALVLVILILLRRHRKKTKNDKLSTQEMNQPIQDELVEKMEVEAFGTVVPLQTDLRSDQCSVFHTDITPDSTENQNHLSGENEDRNNEEKWHANRAIVTDVADENGNVSKQFVQRQDTLFNRLHGETRGTLNRNEIGRRVARALVRFAQHRKDDALLSHVSSHRILVGKQGEVTLLVKSLDGQVNHGQTTQTNKAAEQVNNGEAVPSAKMVETQGIEDIREGVRWEAPEVLEKKADVDVSRAAVFSLGLVLWEIETGDVPFGEYDALNARRQIVAGTRPKLESIPDIDLREIISSCFVMDPTHRPTLDTILSDLELLEGKSKANRPFVIQ